MCLSGIAMIYDCNKKKGILGLSWHTTITKKCLAGIIPKFDHNGKGRTSLELSRHKTITEKSLVGIILA